MRTRNLRLRKGASLKQRPPQAGVSASVVEDDISATDEMTLPLLRNIPIETQSAQLNIGEEEMPESLIDFQGQFEDLFNDQAFLALWREVGKEMYPKLQTVIAKHYSFSDLLQTIEAGLRRDVDKASVLLDNQMETELTALTTFKLVIMFARELFDDDADFSAVRTYLLTPEVAAPVLKKRDGTDNAAQMKAFMEMTRHSQNTMERLTRKAERKKEQPERPVGFTSRRPQRRSPPVNIG